ncbi:MAG TPA: HdeD family acid-resistance protein [Streptosporangiaceae bacterium]|nr:HdeD family acid-resistance protein [Streptosporangiaceae bacterium]
MTEPRSGPVDESGLPGGSGPSGSGPPADMAQGNMGQGDMGQQHMGQTTGATSVGGPGQQPAQGDTSGVTTTTRQQAAQKTVPQQYGPQAEKMEAERGAEGAAKPGLAAEGGLMAAAAGRAWPAVLCGGLLLVAVGVMMFVWPSATLTIIAILIGAALVVSGLVKLFEGFTAKAESGGMRVAYIAIGLLAVLAGLYCLRHHALSLFLVAFVTGVYFIVHGISDLGVAFSGNVPGRALRGVLGVFSIAAGILMVVWPGITLGLLVILVGAWLLFYGLVLCGLAFSLFRAAKEGKRAAEHTPSTTRLATSAR